MKSVKKINVIFFGRKNCEFSLKAVHFLKTLNFSVLEIYSNSRSETIVENDLSTCDYILSFRNLIIIPSKTLKLAKKSCNKLSSWTS